VGGGGGGGGVTPLKGPIEMMIRARRERNVGSKDGQQLPRINGGKQFPCQPRKTKELPRRIPAASQGEGDPALCRRRNRNSKPGNMEFGKGSAGGTCGIYRSADPMTGHKSVIKGGENHMRGENRLGASQSNPATANSDQRKKESKGSGGAGPS